MRLPNYDFTILYRTVNIARQTRWVRWAIGTLFVIVTALEWFTNLYHRIRELGILCVPAWTLKHLYISSGHYQCKYISFIYHHSKGCSHNFLLKGNCSPGNNR